MFWLRVSRQSRVVISILITALFVCRLVSAEETFGGLGIMTEKAKGSDYISVLKILDNTPAQRAGLKEGDTILEVDGRSMRGLSATDSLKYLRGPVGSTVVLTVSRSGSAAPLKISIVRGSITSKGSDLSASMILRSEPNKTRTVYFDKVYPQDGDNSPSQVRIKLEHVKADRDHTHAVRVDIVNDSGKRMWGFSTNAAIKAGEEWHKKDLKEVAVINGGDIFRTGGWPVGNYKVQVTVDSNKPQYIDFAFVRPIDFPTNGRVYVKNLTGEGVRIVWGQGDQQRSIYIAANDAGFITDKDGNILILSPDEVLSYRGRDVRISDAAKWSEAKDGRCYWKLTIGGAATSEDP